MFVSKSISISVYKGSHTTDDNILGPIQDLNGAIWMPHGQITGMQNTPRKEFPRGLIILVVPPSTDVTNKDNLSDLFTAALNIDNSPFRNISLDNPHRQTRHKAMSLSRHLLILLMDWETIPGGHAVSFGNRAVGFGHAVYMHRVQIQIRHLLEEMGCRWTCCHCDLDGLGELLGLVRVAEQGVHGWSGIEMADLLFFQ